MYACEEDMLHCNPAVAHRQRHILLAASARHNSTILSGKRNEICYVFWLENMILEVSEPNFRLFPAEKGWIIALWCTDRTWLLCSSIAYLRRRLTFMCTDSNAAGVLHHQHRYVALPCSSKGLCMALWLHWDWESPHSNQNFQINWAGAECCFKSFTQIYLTKYGTAQVFRSGISK